jgi:hypothetical protein
MKLNGYGIHIMWIPSHEGVMGNERASGPFDRRGSLGRTMGKKHHFGGHKWINELIFPKLFSIFFGLPNVPIT